MFMLYLWGMRKDVPQVSYKTHKALPGLFTARAKHSVPQVPSMHSAPRFHFRPGTARVQTGAKQMPQKVLECWA